MATTIDPTYIRKKRGACLPHWTLEGAAYFVTFRTFDSMPKPLVQELKAETVIMERLQAKRLGRELTVRELSDVRWKIAGKAERYLDQGVGLCLPKIPQVSKLIVETLHHFDRQRYDLHTWCVMPNHVHVIVRPSAGFELPNIVLSWKTWSARQANKFLERDGRFWQREYYDRIIRTPYAFEGTKRYILDNPTKAGLANWEAVGAADYDCEDVLWPVFDFA
jgi:REP element-mobilizing transposase RayT